MYQVQPDIRVEVKPKNVIVTFKKLEEGEWETLPNEKVEKKKKKKGSKAQSPPPSPAIGATARLSSAEIQVAETNRLAQEAVEVRAAAEAKRVAEAEVDARKKEAAAKARQEAHDQEMKQKKEAAKQKKDQEQKKKAAKSKREEVEAAVAAAKAAREQEKKEKAQKEVEKKTAFVASQQSQTSLGINYSKWDNYVDSDDSDDDPSPPKPVTQAPLPVHGVEPPSAGSNSFEDAMLKDPRLVEAARLIQLGQKNGDMASLKKAEKLTREALVSQGMGPEQINRLLGTTPIATPVPAKKEKQRPIRQYDISKPADQKEARSVFESGIEELNKQSAQLLAEQEKLEQIATAGGPEDFFEYMKSQGMTEEDIMALMSGDKSVMQKAVDKKTAELDDATRSTVDRVDEVAAQIDGLKSGKLSPDDIAEAEERRAQEVAGVPPKPKEGIWKAPSKAPSKPEERTKATPPQVQQQAVPTYTIEPVDDSLQVMIELPGVQSVGDIDIDVTRTRLELEVEGLYELKVRLPQPVDDDSVKAKWVKQEHKLCLTLGLE